MPDYNLGTAHGRIRVTADFDDVEQLQKALRNFVRSLNDSDADLDRHTKKQKEAASATRTFLDSLRGAQPRIKGFAIGTLVVQATALASALTPLVGLLGAIPAIGVAGAGGIGVLALAFSGLGDAFKAAGKGPEEFREELKKLDPAARSFVRAIVGLRPELRALQRDARDGLLPGLGEEITRVATQLFPLARGAVRSFAQVLNDGARASGDFLASGVFSRGAQTLIRAGVSILRELGGALGVLGRALFGAAVTGSDLAVRFTELISSWIRGTAEALEFANATGSLRESFDRAFRTFTQLSSIIGNVLLALKGLGAGLAPLGPQVLTSLDQMTAALARFFTALGQHPELMASFAGSLTSVLNALTSLLNAYGRLTPAQQAVVNQILKFLVTVLLVSKVVGVLTNSFAKVAGAAARFSGQIKAFVNVLKAAGGGIGRFFGFFARFVPVIARILPWVLRLGSILARVGAVIAGVATGPVGLIIAVLALVVSGLVLAYRHSEAFRNVVQGAFAAVASAFRTAVAAVQQFIAAFRGGGLQGAINFLRTSLAAGFRSALSGLGNLFSTTFNNIANSVRSALPRILAAVGTWATGLVAAGLRAGQGLVTGFLQFLSTLPERVAFFLGFIIGRVLRWQAQMYLMAAAAGVRFVTGVVQFLSQLPGRVAGFLATIISRVAAWVSQMAARAIAAGQRFLQGVVRFIQQLPGRIASFLSQVLARAASFAQQFPARARAAGQAALNGIVNFVRQIPGRVQTFLQQAVQRIASAATQAAARARQFGQNVINAIRSTLASLPGLVTGLMSRAVAAISSMASAAFARAKAVASSLWNGFKAGLGISSPSFIERAADDIVNNLKGNLKALRQQVIRYNRVGNTLRTPDGTVIGSPRASLSGGTFMLQIQVPPGMDPSQFRQVVNNSELLRLITRIARGRRTG